MLDRTVKTVSSGRRRGLLLAAALLAFASANAGTADAGRFHGVVSQGALTDRDYNRMASGKVGTLRISIRWGSVQPKKSTPRSAWSWAGYDAVVARAAAAGVRVLASLDAPSPGGFADPPTTKGARKGFKRFAAAAAARYGRGGTATAGAPIRAWQIWNEQNGPAYWGKRPNPRDYGKLLRGAAGAVKRNDRKAEIVLGGMFSTPSGRGAIDSWTYLKRLYRVKRIKRAFDTVAVHPYSESLRGIKYQVRKVRNVIKRRNDRRTGLRITEFGWGSARRGHLNLGRKGQARMLKKAFRLFKRKRGGWNVEGANWFSFQDNPDGVCSFCPTAGLFTANRNAKPSWRAFKRVAR